MPYLLDDTLAPTCSSCLIWFVLRIQVASKAGVCCHTDACLGGFLLPFARKLGYPVPAWDFAVPGVTSMSLDTHKFGMAHKGTSVVLYRSKAIRRYQYTRITDWSGGLYISPGKPGSHWIDSDLVGETMFREAACMHYADQKYF